MASEVISGIDYYPQPDGPNDPEKTRTEVARRAIPTLVEWGPDSNYPREHDAFRKAALEEDGSTNKSSVTKKWKQAEYPPEF